MINYFYSVHDLTDTQLKVCVLESYDFSSACGVLRRVTLLEITFLYISRGTDREWIKTVIKKKHEELKYWDVAY